MFLFWIRAWGVLAFSSSILLIPASAPTLRQIWLRLWFYTNFDSVYDKKGQSSETLLNSQRNLDKKISVGTTKLCRKGKICCQIKSIISFFLAEVAHRRQNNIIYHLDQGTQSVKQILSFTAQSGCPHWIYWRLSINYRLLLIKKSSIFIISKLTFVVSVNGF